MNYAKSIRMSLGILVCYLAARIKCAIVNNNDFQLAHRLLNQAVKTLRQNCRNTVCGYYDRYLYGCGRHIAGYRMAEIGKLKKETVSTCSAQSIECQRVNQRSSGFSTDMRHSSVVKDRAECVRVKTP